MTQAKKSLLSLLLLVPAPSIGAFCAMVAFPGTVLGQVIFAFSKAWLFGFPLVWLLLVDRIKPSLSPPKNGGFGVGAASGIVISAFIIGLFFVAQDKLIDQVFLVKQLKEVGLTSKPLFIGCAAYWILINSVLEEYVWRWFVVRQCESLFSPKVAVLCSALFFTFHHVVAMQVYFGAFSVALCSLGIFVGGAIWSLMYIKYRSIWPGYLSHAIVDLCIFSIGAYLLGF